MLSALKRLSGGGSASKDGEGAPPSHQTMSTNLQRKFAKGVQYNMKIVIKGDRNTGKTCLFHRLQGGKFKEEYIPTDEIQVTSIQWAYKTMDDVVKVEVWDVVDVGRKRPPLGGLKLSSTASVTSTNRNDSSGLTKVVGGGIETPALDAEFLDIYKGTHGVIMVVDITKRWTLDYVERELPRVPTHIPVLILGNHCDMSHHAQITSAHVDAVIASMAPGRNIRYTEASMANGYGLKYLHQYLCIPYLELQRVALQAQMERNVRETSATLAELDLYQQHYTYDRFVSQLSDARRQAADKVSSAIAAGGGAVVVGRGKPISGTPKASITSPSSPAAPPSSSASLGSPPPTQHSGQQRQKQPVQQKVNNTLPSVAASSTASPSTTSPTSPSGRSGGLVGMLQSIDEFVPDDGSSLDKSFLDSGPTEVVPNSGPANNSDSECSSVGGGNPLVSGYQEDLDSDDELSLASLQPDSRSNPVKSVNVSRSPVLSSSPLPAGPTIQTPSLPTKANQWYMEGRGSPEGGEDGSSEPGRCTDSNANNSVAIAECTVFSNINVAQESKINSKPKHKKKSKEKVDGDIEERRRKKKSSRTKKHHRSSISNDDDTNSNITFDTSYELI